jgi:hypothetical protein
VSSPEPLTGSAERRVRAGFRAQTKPAMMAVAPPPAKPDVLAA